MSFPGNNLTNTNLVINTVPNKQTAVLPSTVACLFPAANRSSFAKFHEDFAQRNKFPEEKLDTQALQPMGSSTETEVDKQPSETVMQIVGTPDNYPDPSQERLSQNEDASDALQSQATSPAEDASDASQSQATSPAVRAKRHRRQVLLGLLYHFIATKNLAALYRLKASEELNSTLRNMIEDAILGILWSRQTSRSNNRYVTRAVMTDWLLANFNKVELWQLVQEEEDIYQLILEKKNSDVIET